jgi:O-antigen/teichoic acid export membrane protein
VVTSGLLMGLSNLGMIQALVQRPSPTSEEFDTGWTVNLLRAALVTAVLLVFGPLLAGLFDEPGAAPIIRAMAIRPFIAATASIGVVNLTRNLAFKRLAAMTLPAAIVEAVTSIALAPSLGVWALVVGTLSGAVAQTLLSYVVAPHRPRLRFDRAGATPLVRYGQWILYTGIVALIGTSLTQVGISRILGVSSLGMYFVASKLAFLPGEAAAAVIGAVAFPLYAAQRRDPDRSAATFRVLWTGQAVLFLPLFAIIIALAPALEGALGARWAGTALTTQILTASCMIGLFGDCVSPLLEGQGRADQSFVIEVVQTGGRLLFLLPLMSMFGLAGAALSWLVGNALAQIAAAIIIRDVLRRSLEGLAKKRLASGVTAAAVAGATAATAAMVLTGFTALAAGGIMAAATTVVTWWGLDRLLDLRWHELLPWHATWGLHPATAAVPQDRIDA